MYDDGFIRQINEGDRSRSFEYLVPIDKEDVSGSGSRSHEASVVIVARSITSVFGSKHDVRILG